MYQIELNHSNLKFELELQHKITRQRKSRSSIILIVLSIMFILYVFIQSNKYIDQQNQILHDNANSTNNMTEINQILNEYKQLQHVQIFEKILSFPNFYGTWTDSQNTSNQLALSQIKLSYNDNSQFELKVKLFEGQLIDDYQNEFSFYLNIHQLVLPLEDNKYVYENINATYKRFSNFKTNQSITEIYANLTMILHHVNIYSPTLPELTFELKSNCQLNSKIYSFSSNFYVYRMSTSVANYMWWSIIFFSLQMVFICKFFCLIIEKNQSQQFSKLIFVFLMIADGYQAIEHFLFGQNAIFVDPQFILMTAFFGLIYCFIESCLAMIFWFHHVQDKQILTKIFTFCLLSIILAILIYYYTKIFNFIAINLSLLPQIINVAYNNHQEQFDEILVFGILFFKQLMSIYYVDNPHNILQESEWPIIKYILILTLFAAQVIVYYFQCEIESRFFLPRLQRWKKIKKVKEGECAICIGKLIEISTESQLDSKCNIEKDDKCIIEKDDKFIIETPCGHYFHSVCLSKWMDIQQNCPICRSIFSPQFKLELTKNTKN